MVHFFLDLYGHCIGGFEKSMLGMYSAEFVGGCFVVANAVWIMTLRNMMKNCTNMVLIAL